MKTIFRFAGTGVLSATLLAVGAVASYGQDACADVDAQTAVYTKFTGLYNKKAVGDMETALTTGKEFLEKYGACESLAEQVKFVKPHVERIEKALPLVKKSVVLGPLFERFDKGIDTSNGDEVYSAGKAILAIDTENLNVMVPLGIAGLYQSYNNKPQYADDTIRYAKMAIEKLKAGAPATKKNKAGADVYGVFQYELTKEQAIDEMSYAIANLTYYAKKDRAGALPLYYQIAQTNTRYKDDPRVYQTMGSYFGSEVLRLTGEVAKLIAEQKALPTEEAKVAMEPKIKETIGLLNGNADRTMEYYSRAYKLAKSDTPAAKTYKDGLYKDLGILYEGRTQKKEGLDAYISSAAAKPLPNPTTPVTPVNEEPVTTTSSAPAAAATKATTTAAPVTAKPAAAATTKPMSTTTTTTTKTTTKKTAAVRKRT